MPHYDPAVAWANEIQQVQDLCSVLFNVIVHWEVPSRKHTVSRIGIFNKRIGNIHPWKQTWNLKMDPWKRRHIYKSSIFGFHVCFPGSINLYLWWISQLCLFIYRIFTAVRSRSLLILGILWRYHVLLWLIEINRMISTSLFMSRLSIYKSNSIKKKEISIWSILLMVKLSSKEATHPHLSLKNPWCFRQHCDGNWVTFQSGGIIITWNDPTR